LESACDTSALMLTTSSQGLIPRLASGRILEFRFDVAKLAFHQRRLSLGRKDSNKTIDRAVIIVDAGGLSFSAHNEIWTGGRERISNTNILRTAI
jgi:hypothetical protein